MQSGAGAGAPDTKSESRYSLLDRALHRLAFSTIEIQKGLADLEDKVYSKDLARMEIDRSVFITSLPRAGTTLLLDVIASTGSFGSHTYRDLPFLLMPLLWNTISSGGGKRNGIEIERAHGDGMTIGYDSHEAFEEVLWRAYWPHKYLEDRILTWEEEDRDPHDEFDSFFRSHIRKLLLLRGATRYISKNNANISHIPKLLAMFPDATVLVPFRRPVDHAISMWRQHQNFTQIHADEPFTRRYMADIGHYDFGANLRPVAFGDLSDSDIPESPDDICFWLWYWCTAFECILELAEHPRVAFVNYDLLCDAPVSGLNNICDLLGVTDLDISAQAARFRPSNSYHELSQDLPGDLIERATTINLTVERTAVN